MWCVFPATFRAFGLLVRCKTLHTRKAFPTELGTGFVAKALWIVSRKGRAVASCRCPLLLVRYW